MSGDPHRRQHGDNDGDRPIGQHVVEVEDEGFHAGYRKRANGQTSNGSGSTRAVDHALAASTKVAAARQR
jgi:hypothetical protein